MPELDKGEEPRFQEGVIPSTRMLLPSSRTATAPARSGASRHTAATRIRGRSRQAPMRRRALGHNLASHGHRHVAITVALNRVVARPVMTM
jgi:hypothetical protein